MDDYLKALAFAVMPILGNLVGGLLAELIQVSQRSLSLALHGAAGVVLGVVGVELMPEALAAESPWVVIIAFLAGGVFFVVIDQVIALVRSRSGAEESSAGPWVIFFGVAVDLFSDGVMIGTGTSVGLALGLLLALGQVPADIPEGFATMATFKRQGFTRRIRLLLTAALAVPILAGATIGYWAVQGQPELVKLSLLAFTAGILTTVVVEEIVPQAHQDGESRLAALILVGGFALFALLSAYVGE